VTEEKNIQ